MMKLLHFIRRRALALPAVMLLAVWFFVACDRSSDAPTRVPEREDNGGRDDGKPTNPGGDRPGASDKDYDFSKEITDATLRYDGRGTVLRLDSCGVLVRTLADGTCEFIDLDGQARAAFLAGEMKADSLCPGTLLRVNGQGLDLKSVRMKKQTAGAVWYHIVDCDGRSHIVVTP